MKVNQKIKNEFPSYSDYCNESMVAKLGILKSTSIQIRFTNFKTLKTMSTNFRRFSPLNLCSELRICFLAAIMLSLTDPILIAQPVREPLII